MGDRTLDAPTSSYTVNQEREGYPSKRLIVCCDGTFNAGDSGQPLTNVAKIARCIADVDEYKEKDSDRNFIQIVHYQAGVGTGTGTWATKIDAITGRGLSKNIRTAYNFICLNWSNYKDEIVLIGFSRGAFTVRCVAQFIHDVGLLTKSGLRHLPELFKMWKRLDPKSSTYRNQRGDLDKRCKDLESWGELMRESPERRKIRIQACVVWDTVRAMNQPKYRTVGQEIPRNVKLAVQALAIDEPRHLFKPMEWCEPPEGTDQVLKQRWFAGNHSDIGGGNKDMTNANITLAWVIGQLTRTIQFREENLWTITTTRSWSKPSPLFQPPSETRRNSVHRTKLCRVVATTPISSNLLHSETSWLSWFTRVVGNPLASSSRRPDDEDLHWSVHVLRHLGITKQEACPSLLEEVIRLIPQDDETKFEGKILDEWANHIMYAHVNLNQARTAAETMKPGDSTYDKCANARLRQDDEAGYKNEIPTSALLSVFYKSSVAKNHIITEQVYGSSNPHQGDPKFRFWFIEKDTRTILEADKSSEESLVINQVKGVPCELALTKTIRLAMGRAHEMGAEPKLTRTQKVMAPFRALTRRRGGDNSQVRPCEKCAGIWETEDYTKPA